jgi:hypothetical protein
MIPLSSFRLCNGGLRRVLQMARLEVPSLMHIKDAPHRQ